MVVQGSSTVGRTYYPLKDTPDLFQKFKNLSLDRDSLLGFANEYGWIGERGMVQYGDAESVRAVGLSTWVEQIQRMTVADGLLTWVSVNDQPALRRYFVWHQEKFDVKVQIEMNGKTIRPFTPPPDLNPELTPRPDRVILHGWLVGSHIMPHEVPDLPKLGWGKHDLTRPALVIAASIINDQLWQFCRPMLTVDHKNARLRGYWTAANLLGCMWLQFYLSVIGQLKLRRCAVCGREMDVSNSRSSKRIHESCSRTERQRRWRAKKKAQTVEE